MVARMKCVSWFDIHARRGIDEVKRELFERHVEIRSVAVKTFSVEVIAQYLVDNQFCRSEKGISKCPYRTVA